MTIAPEGQDFRPVFGQRGVAGFGPGGCGEHRGEGQRYRPGGQKAPLGVAPHRVTRGYGAWPASGEAAALSLVSVMAAREFGGRVFSAAR